MDLNLEIGGDNPYAEKEPKAPVVVKSEFPMLIDNTSREQYATCPQKFFRSTIQKLAPDYPSIHLHFGGAYAAGLEEMRKAFYVDNKSQRDALEAGIKAATLYFGDFEVPEKSNKTYAALCGALINYIDKYPLATDHIKPVLHSEGAAVEFTFSTPIPDCFHPVTGDPILYGGRFDFLGEFQNLKWVVDDKTTSQLGPSWNKQWELNSQFTGYTWGAQQSGIDVAGAVIRGQSILKNGYGHAEVIIYRPQWQLDRWLNMLVDNVQAMISDWERNQYAFAIGGACSHYGGCEFLHLCTKQDPLPWIQTHYRLHNWNPLAKNPEAGDSK